MKSLSSALPSTSSNRFQLFFLSHGRPRRRGPGGSHVARPSRRERSLVSARRGTACKVPSAAAEIGLGRRRRRFLASGALARRKDFPQEGLLRRSSRALARSAAAPLPCQTGQCKRQRRRRKFSLFCRRRRGPALGLLPSLVDDLEPAAPAAVAPARAGRRQSARRGAAGRRRDAVRVRRPRSAVEAPFSAPPRRRRRRRERQRSRSRRRRRRRRPLEAALGHAQGGAAALGTGRRRGARRMEQR